MSWWVYGTVWFIIWVVCLWLVWRMVDRKDLNRAGWIILTIFFPIIGLIVVAILPARRRPEPPETLPDDGLGLKLRRGGRRIRAARPVASVNTCRAASRGRGGRSGR